MPVEWAWIGPQPRVELPDRGMFRPGEGNCVVMLLHGLTGSPAELGYVARYLQNRGGYAVHCPRLVNHGQPIGVLARTNWRQLHQSARDGFLEARQLARSRGVPLVIGGLSLGAVLSLLLAAEFPDDVAGVACLAPTLFYDGWSVPWYHKLLPLADYTPLKYFTYFREEEPFGLRNESLRQKVAAQYASMSLRDAGNAATAGYAHFPVRLFCEMQRLVAWCKRILPDVTAPVLLVQAEHDDVSGPRNARYIFDRIGSARRELLLLKQSYHLVCADIERSVVADRLLGFCRSLAGSRSAVPAKSELYA